MSATVFLVAVAHLGVSARMRSRRHNAVPSPDAGFTLTEVLVVIAIIAIMASLLLSAASAAKSKTWGLAYINNQRQLLRAYLMYAHDHGDDVLKATSWCGNGYVNWTDDQNNLDEAMLVGPSSLVAPYIGKAPRLFKCPADQYLRPVQRAWGFAARVRSVAMNQYSGSRHYPEATPTKWRGWTKVSDVVTQAPATLFVLLDEHPDSIHDAMFFATTQLPKTREGPFRWSDIPATYHAGGVNFAFLDGHAALKKWRGRLKTREWTNVQYRDRHEDAFMCREAGDADDLTWVTARMAETN